MTPELEIRPTGVSPVQIAAYEKLLTSVFGVAPKFEARSLEWLYRDNPQGQVVGFDAWSGDTLAAHYVTIPTTAEVEGQVRRGLLSLNTATHPDFQGRKLFTTLADRTYARAAGEGFSFVVGVANANSTPGFTRKLGFDLVEPLWAGVVLSPPRRLGQAESVYRTEWSPEALAWRLANPVARYRKRGSGEVTAVTAPTHVRGLRCAAFLPHGGAAEALPSAPVPLPVLFLGLEPRVRIASPNWIPLPEKARSSPLNLIYRSLDGSTPVLKGPVAFNFLDFDPY